MANITPVYLDVNAGKAVTFASADAFESTDKLYDSTKTNGAYFKANEKDQKYVVLLKNGTTSAIDVYVVKGDDEVFGAFNDLKVNVPASSTVAINVESARYKQMTSDKGHKEEILFKSASAFSVAVIKLP